MGRRARRRGASPAANHAPKKRDRQARVSVTNEVWREFKGAVGQRPIGARLGELVEREVERHRARRIRENDVDDQELLAALDRGREMAKDMQDLVVRLEQRIEARRELGGG